MANCVMGRRANPDDPRQIYEIQAGTDRKSEKPSKEQKESRQNPRKIYYCPTGSKSPTLFENGSGEQIHSSRTENERGWNPDKTDLVHTQTYTGGLIRRGGSQLGGDRRGIRLGGPEDHKELQVGETEAKEESTGEIISSEKDQKVYPGTPYPDVKNGRKSQCAHFLFP